LALIAKGFVPLRMALRDPLTHHAGLPESWSECSRGLICMHRQLQKDL
jgi:hypothetical protein